jgi:tetratricopeptide (TPR) repeat protein
LSTRLFFRATRASSSTGVYNARLHAGLIDHRNRRRSHHMKNCLAALIALGVLAAPALAQQSKLDQAIAKADEQVQKGKPDDAVKTLTKAAHEAGAEGQVALGRLQERLGNLDAAAAAYQAAAAAGASNADVLAAAANFTLRRGKARDAQGLAAKAVAAGQTPAALAALSRAMTRLSDPAALSTADKAIAAGASNATAHLARAAARLASGKPAAAEAAARKAAELDPKSALAQARLAQALAEQKKGAEAIAAGKRATEIDDKLGEAYAAHGLALVTAEPQKNWSEAIAQAQQGAFVDPENPFVQSSVARIFEVSGQMEQAANAYKKALQADSEYAPANGALIQAELASNREAALARIKDAADKGTATPELYRILGEDLLRKGEFAAATPYLEKATAGQPAKADGWALLGRAYHSARRYEDAADAYKKAVELASDNVNFRATYGLILGQADKLEEGLNELKRVVATPGYKDAAGWTNLGWLYRNLNKPQESIEAYKKALELDPKQEQAALGLGWAYSYVKDYDNAIAAYQKALEIDPKEAAPDANLGLAWSYFFKGVKSASKDDAAKAKEFATKAGAAGRNVTQVNQKIADLEKAIETGQMMTAEALERAQEAQAAAEEEQKKVEAANRMLGSKSPASRAAGCRQVAALAGGGAVPALVTLLQTDPSYDVRIACTQALGTLGGAARSAVRNVEAMLRQPNYQAPATGATAADLDNEMKDGDYRRALRDTLAKIR